MTLNQPSGGLLLYWDSFLFALAFMLLIWLIGFAMDRSKIYIKV